MSSGGSQTSNHTASNPPAFFGGRKVVGETGSRRVNKGRRRIRTAGDAAANNARHRDARIEQLSLLLRLDFNAGEVAHLAHFTTNLLYKI